MAEKQTARERFREAARVAGLQRLTDELGERIACEGCPAAEFIGQVRGEMAPGVRCRIEHSTLSLVSDPRSILRWCSHGSVGGDRRNGYVGCPTWQFEKDRLALGQHSLGDEGRLEQLAEATWREDATGSPQGDLSIWDEAAAAAANTVETWQEQHADRRAG